MKKGLNGPGKVMGTGKRLFHKLSILPGGQSRVNTVPWRVLGARYWGDGRKGITHYATNRCYQLG
jgi:hypothetical protein